MDQLNEIADLQENDPTKEVMVEAFRRHGVIHIYRKNEFVFQENDLPSSAFYVESGLIKISQSSEEGQGITLFLRYAGEVFGNAEVLTNIPRKRYAKYLVDSQIITLDGRKFLELAKENAEFSYSIAVLSARRLLQTQKMVETLISRPVAWRLAWFLMQLGKPMDEKLEVQVPLSHEEISYVIGCSRQTVTETLNKWRDKALIDYAKKKIVIFHPNRFFSDIKINISLEGDHMITINNVNKSFSQRKGNAYTALEKVSLTIGKGEFVSVVGPSGCGKSTLLNLIAGFEKVSSGTITVNGQRVTAPGADRIVVFQEHGLFPWLTVLDNVAFGLKQKGLSKKERYALAFEQIKAVHLSKFVDRYPHELSGGMKQRVAIARALVMDPDILLMDEPFAALDEQTRFILLKDLEEIWLKTGKTILFITHNIREAVILSDRVIVMSTQPGRIKKEFAVQAERPHQSGDPLILGHEYSLKKNTISNSSIDHLGVGI